MGIEVLQAGTFTTVQDKGRYGWAHLGVPVAGCMDQQSAQLANWMVGNQPTSAVLEMTWTGMEFTCQVDCSMALAGAEFECSLNGRIINTDQVINLRIGDHFKMHRLLQGVRAYLAFAGGFDLTAVGGSYSTLVVAGLGGYAGRSLQAGDVLRLKQPTTVASKTKPQWKKLKRQSIHVIRAMPGPEYDCFTPAVIRQAFGQAYQLSSAANRQGFRLIAAAIETPKGFHMNSSGLVPGSLQVTPDGQTILAMQDAQTTGGYPRILVVDQSQIHQLAQIRTDEDVYFYVGHDQRKVVKLAANYQ